MKSVVTLACLAGLAVPPLAFAPAPPDPDMLVVVSVSIDRPEPRAPERVRIVAQIRNVAAELPVVNHPWEILVGAQQIASGHIGNLPAGRDFLATADWSSVAGPHTITARVTPHALETTQEGRWNNSKQRPITVKAALGAPAGPAPAPGGTTPVGTIPYQPTLVADPANSIVVGSPIALTVRDRGAAPASRRCRFEALRDGGLSVWSETNTDCTGRAKVSVGRYTLKVTITDTGTNRVYESTIRDYTVTAAAVPGGGGGGRPFPAPPKPIIRGAAVEYFNVSFRLDYTVCNIDTDAAYDMSLSPTGPMPGYAGNPPEDFLPGAYNGDGTRLTPACPAGTGKGLKPAHPRGIVANRPAKCGTRTTYTLTATARKDGLSTTSDPFQFTVTAPCGPVPAPSR